jgi:N-acyl homoserine lactone hydrolase
MPSLKMSAMNVGPLSCAKNLLVAMAPGNVDVPTTSVVIEHPKHGVVVWDTGINEAVADPQRGDAYWGPGLRAAFGTHAFTREHVVDKQLEKLGFRPKDVRYVVYSQSAPRSCRRHVVLSRGSACRSARRDPLRAVA